MLRGHSEFLYSKEGITQGDPLSMFVYAVATLPLIRMLSDTAKWIQMWYADDTSAGGLLSDLYDWFTLLCSCGLAFGYPPQPSKCFVVVAAPFQCQAEDIFGKLGVKVVTGHRFWVVTLVIPLREMNLCFRKLNIGVVLFENLLLLLRLNLR